MQRGYEHVLNMDADFSHPPRYLPALLAGMDPAGGPAVDVMIGSRYIPGGGVEGWPLRRQLDEPRHQLVRPMAAGPDAEGLQRRISLLSRRRCWPGSTLPRFARRGYSFQEEILWHLSRLGARFGETPIVFVDRRRGASKIDLREALGSLRTIFCLGLKSLLRRPPRPKSLIPIDQGPMGLCCGNTESWVPCPRLRGHAERGPQRRACPRKRGHGTQTETPNPQPPKPKPPIPNPQSLIPRHAHFDLAGRGVAREQFGGPGQRGLHACRARKEITTIMIRVVAGRIMVRSESLVVLPKGPKASTKTGSPARRIWPRPIPA